jgi:pSer/pThr/pTyr-binding forkhead associated (FHA) protein
MSEEAQIIRIGRGQGCDLVLSHASVSRRHAELTIEPDGAILIRDLNSTGGTFVLRNGKEIPVTRTQLKRSDGLRLGDYEISVENLLSLIEEANLGTKPAQAAPPVVVEAEDRPKTRMVRCACGTIKERGKVCPACGA